MQPARLGAGTWFCVSIALLGLVVLAPPSRAQAVLETPQQTNDRIRELSAAARRAPHDYVIGNGDLLSIEVFDVKELSREARVSQTGTIGIPLVPLRLHVSGLTEIQAEQKIAEVLEADGLVSHPEVSVTVRERKSKPITVVGAVAHPLVYQADREVTLLEVLAEAGGLSNDAGDQVIITRPVPQMTFEDSESPAISPGNAAPANSQPGKRGSAPAATSAPSLPASANGAVAEPPELPDQSHSLEKSINASGVPSASPATDTITVNLYQLMESGNIKNNILLQAGDVVTVPHAGIVYVLGAVGRPGGFVLTNDREQLNTLKILALAGGFTRTAKTDHAVVIRKDAQGQQHETQIDLKKILERKAEDVQLQPSDILYVPESGAKQAILRSLEFGIALGSAVALYRLAYH
ncbi:MAG TPA: polysaccharide biosynthesis/export family protein [Candidatus Acidoferrum sp.]|nr:polysaccharide biosynthesis/export family protein [Candidatus Acidoferrum sp.]